MKIGISSQFEVLPHTFHVHAETPEERLLLQYFMKVGREKDLVAFIDGGTMSTDQNGYSSIQFGWRKTKDEQPGDAENQEGSRSLSETAAPLEGTQREAPTTALARPAAPCNEERAQPRDTGVQ